MPESDDIAASRRRRPFTWAILDYIAMHRDSTTVGDFEIPGGRTVLEAFIDTRRSYQISKTKGKRPSSR